MKTVRWVVGLRIGVVLGSALALFSPQTVQAQYEVFQWGNFEDGKLPASSKLVRSDAANVMSVVELDKVPGMPPEFRSAEAAQETGKYALCIKARPAPDQKFSITGGLAIGETLNREKLGANGRSLYQMDFFIPTQGQTPDVAVLAMEAGSDPAAKTLNPTSFYRFGVTAGRVYFSLLEPTTNTATIYKVDKGLTDGIPRPGWHRFAIAFEGREKIRCFVDGREASFSPIMDSKLQSLSVGVLAAWKTVTYDAYIDNLSIQSTTDEMVMPVSPYSAGWKFPEGPASMRKSATASAPAAPKMPGLNTLTSWVEPEAAWARAKSENRPFLIYFGAQNVPAVEELNRLMETDSNAKSYLQRCSCSKVDMNQLRGGTIARQYAVFKAPTILVISPDAKSSRRATFRKGDGWENVASQLSGI
ncbi:MAG: hypothetical protein K1X53_11540 [Candidatus Sumerlaeaceae bacterium]|nr:hypothetical protein [Candidatus Sumerlaeaceae bacterium]